SGGSGPVRSRGLLLGVALGAALPSTIGDNRGRAALGIGVDGLIVGGLIGLIFGAAATEPPTFRFSRLRTRSGTDYSPSQCQRPVKSLLPLAISPVSSNR